MKKQIYFLSFFLMTWGSICSPITANQPQEASKAAASTFFTKGRIGIGLGLEYLHVDVGLKVQPTQELSFMESKQSQTGKHFQVAPCIELGKTIANDYYLGFLLSWRYSGLKATATAPIYNSISFNHEFRLNHYADFLMKMGYKFSHRTMFYGLIGPTIANWSHKSLVVRDMLISNQFQLDKTSFGLGIGLGFEYQVKKNYMFSIDFTYHLHSAATKSKYMTVIRTIPVIGNRPFSGDVNKKIDLSFSTVTLRFTKFFSL
jgi:opacity protein-like surface antigen